MWTEVEGRRVFAYTKPTDMRKPFQGLLASVPADFRDQEARSGDLFLSVNREGSYVKVLAGIGRASWCSQRSSSAPRSLALRDKFTRTGS